MFLNDQENDKTITGPGTEPYFLQATAQTEAQKDFNIQDRAEYILQIILVFYLPGSQ
jgi:hypothetical protein